MVKWWPRRAKKRPWYAPDAVDSGVKAPKILSSGMAGFSEVGMPEDWDLAVGEIYGYRFWRMRLPACLAGFALSPPMSPGYYDEGLEGANNYRWQPGRQEATCTNMPTGLAQLTQVSYRGPQPSFYEILEHPVVHEPPETRIACGCGFWGYFDPEINLCTHFTHMSGLTPRKSGDYVTVGVFGVIKGSGRVIVGEKGFRSQYAEIAGLCLTGEAKRQFAWDRLYDYHYDAIYSHNLTGGVGLSSRVYSHDVTGIARAAEQDIAAARLTKLADIPEVIGRLLVVEGVLGTRYPGVKIFSSEEDLVRHFPPDTSYAPKAS